MTVPELHRPQPLARIEPGMEVVVEASPAEREALAARLMLPAIGALSCRFRLQPLSPGVVRAEGMLQARIVQTCVVTLEPFESDLAEAFAVRFVPEAEVAEEIDFEAEDEIPYAGAAIDLGEAAAEQLALALDPYPRKPGVALPAHEAGEQDGAFAALSRLRRPS